MLSTVKNVFGYLFSQPEVISYKEAVEILNKPDDDEKKPVAQEEEVHPNQCFQTTGTLTYLDEHYGTIDNDLYFDNKYATMAGLHVGAKISYLAYTIDGVTKISKLLMKVDDEWDTPEPEKHYWCNRRIIGRVSERNNREVIVDSGDEKIPCNLNNIQSEFVPVVGDWVELTCVVELNENVPNLKGQVLDVNKISPLRPKIIQAVITVWSDELLIGVINKDIFFTKDSCIPGYIPIVGDRIVAEIIESEQRRCTWRALKVVPEEKKSQPVENEKINSNLLDSKKGVVITSTIVVTAKKLGEQVTFNVEVSNFGCEPVKVIGGHVKSRNVEQSQIKLQYPNLERPFLIEPNKTILFKFICTARFMGSTRELFIFIFEDFEIGRYIDIEVVANFDKQSIMNQKNKIDVVKNARTSILHSSKDILLGQKPVRPPSFITNKLPMYDIPQRITEALFDQMESHTYISEIPIENVAPSLKSALTIHSYADRFHTLVYLEELSLQINMHKYDMERACFIKNGEYLMLEVADLNERRPSIILGDKIMASNPNALNSPKLEGFVHKTGAKHVYLKFHPNFHEVYAGEDYTIEFQSSRTNFRRYHQAIDLAVRNLGKDFLFPNNVQLKSLQLVFECEDEEKLLLTGSGSNKNEDNKILETNVCTLLDKLDLSTKKPIGNKETNLLKLDEATTPDAKSKINSYGRMAQFALKQKLRQSSSPESVIPAKPNVCPVKLEWFDKKLNHFQKNAVKNILKGEARPLPYFIFGPPGTGKTVTLIETILQITRLIPDSRLLVVAPSNSAADLIALRLLDSNILIPGDLVRMVAFRCVADGSIPERLIPYCVTGDIAREGSRECKLNEQNGVQIGVQASVLGRHRITIGTCMVVGNIYTMGFPRGHFTHILIDEAGQATEPEVLIPLCLLDVDSAQTVLAGDPLQLGPCVFSRLSEVHGLSESFFERLINRFPYVRDPVGFPETGGYDPRLVTRLVYNYRSLPEILELPNKLFYDSELIPTISSENGEEVDLLKKLFDVLPKRLTGHPPSVVFHGVRGENFQTPDSPSWFNPSEAGQVFYYVNDLYRNGLKAKDIGVITPYIKQGQQVRSLFYEGNLEMPKVGSVEEFQGQEFKVIILTTVRSNEAGAKTDAKYGLGFMASPRRLNVAITRAQALLIIVGNPHLLCTDNYWRSVLSYSIKIGGYRGCDLPAMFSK